MFQDYLFFAVDTKVQYCYRMLHLSNLMQEVKKIHSLNTPRTLLLSDSMLGCVLLSSVLDYEERINLRIQCGGDFTIGAETTFQAETKGYIECADDTPIVQSLDKGEKCFSELQVRSLRSQRNNAGLSEGFTLSKTSSIEDALNEHLQSSFQMNTKLQLSSWIDEKSGEIHAFGVIYQELPDISDEASEKLRNHIENLPSMRELFLENNDPDILAQKLIPDELKAIKSINPKLVCSCSQEKVEGVLVTLPMDELKDIIKKSESVEMKCHYCSTNYQVPFEKVMQMFASRNYTQDNSSEIN
ncbi:Hsp33 family molecular chaperone HslO [Fluviispira sanaruensis]|uniref:Hsp33 family molecular chaperone HslO n=1 Tax=Fluviispira sanaruensis TaxID=2493639 RepID=A0A4P2VNJ2_FLUSA|nr:Hsp33 family molecular chaperone HslO [Fluviispira sanaruensis]BBH54448.1 Hsp33 family molecular chaperone HslO [Fluviispira sanaruensis]